ncbi:TnsD family Tn7-like transposition protein [Paraburkholderia terrae]|uniref:TnsD family Tn7-like transposition protein n=1 Tax=Paraburkholderia terrae TaxID=311230 RepID=UPI0033654506
MSSEALKPFSSELIVAIRYFPGFYPDELFASAVARYHVHTASRAWTVTNEELFGIEAAGIGIEFPLNLGAFAERTSELLEMSATEVAWAHSLAPFFTTFCDLDTQDFVLKRMESNFSNRTPFYGFGMGAWLPRAGKHLKQCPECVADDLQTYGETYFRRLHQIPGVFCCVQHGCVLFDTHHLYRQPSRVTAAIASSSGLIAPCIQKLSAFELERYIAFAKECQRALERSPMENRSRDRSLYGERALTLGYRRGQRVDRLALEAGLLEFYGASFLNSMSHNVTVGKEGSWVLRMYKASAFRSGPVSNLLLDVFLKEHESKRQGLVLKPAPWRCQNFLAPHYGEAVVTHFRLIGPNRKNPRRSARFTCSCGYVFSAFVDNIDGIGEPIANHVIERGPIFAAKAKELRVAGRSLKGIARDLKAAVPQVKRLLAFDASAAETVKPGARANISSKGGGRPKSVKSSPRDLPMTLKVREAAAEIMALPVTRRLTVNYIAAYMYFPSLKYLANSGRYPALAACLEELSESVEQVQCRRLQRAWETFPTTVRMTRYKLLRRASLSSDKLPSQVSTLLDELLSKPQPDGMDLLPITQTEH